MDGNCARGARQGRSPVSTPALQLDGLTLAYGPTLVLHQLTLAIPSGALVAVLGPNGAGKSTLFRALLGLIRPAAGRLTVLGTAPASARAAIGYLPQTYVAPPAQLSGYAIVASAVRGTVPGLPLPSVADRAEIDRVLALVEGDRLASRPFASLSGGERQRLRLAQALLGQKRLLLLDEPLASLDPAARRTVVSLIARLRATLGCTVLLSAHDINPLLGTADQVLYLAGGRAALGPPQTVITAPVLTALYGAPVDVIRAGDRLMVIDADA